MNKLYWLVSYPKSGNTWLRIFLANYLRARHAPVDINKLTICHISSDRDLFDRWAGVESSDLSPEDIEELRPHVYRQMAQHLHEPSFFKVHDALTRNPSGDWLFPPEVTGAAIYLIRNPLDVAVSYAHHGGDSVAKTVALMCNPAAVVAENTRKLPEQLPQKLLSWSDHVRSWVDQTELPVAVFRYEDLLARPGPVFAEILQKLDLALDPERLEQALAFSRFENLQARETTEGFSEKMATATAPFFRKGRAGSWREELSPELAEQIIITHAEIMRRFGYLDENGQPVY